MKEYYCYTHATPDRKVFYVGKGSGNRAMAFRRRNEFHHEVVALYGKENIIVEVFPCVDELDALHMERFLIATVFGKDNLTNILDGILNADGTTTTPTERSRKYREEQRRNDAQRPLFVMIPTPLYEALTRKADAAGVTLREVVISGLRAS